MNREHQPRRGPGQRPQGNRGPRPAVGGGRKPGSSRPGSGPRPARQMARRFERPPQRESAPEEPAEPPAVTGAQPQPRTPRRPRLTPRQLREQAHYSQRSWVRPHPALVPVALRVIRGCDREHPADRVLAQLLGADPWLEARVRREVAEAVFAYFRWFGWLDSSMRGPEQLAHARELDAAYQQDPEALRLGDLSERAVPPWVHSAVTVEEGWLRLLQRHPLLWLRSRPGGAGALLRQFQPGAAEPGGLPDALCYRGTDDLHRHPGFVDGSFEIQDLSSQAVGSVCSPRPGERWWDVCAGEGGKTLHLSHLMQNRGQIWATDRAGWRLQRLRRRAARAGVSNYQAATWDGTGAAPIPFACDGVLVDAPCTGIGTWHRNPHARWTARPEDVQELAEAQWHLLQQGASKVKPGGRLVYSVCTLSHAETSGVADRADADLQGFEPVPLTNPLGGDAKAAPRLSLRPWALGANGMFVAVWRRA